MTDNHSHEQTHDSDEVRLTSILRALDADVPPADAEAIARVRQISLDAFLQQPNTADSASVAPVERASNSAYIPAAPEESASPAAVARIPLKTTALRSLW